MPAHNFGSGLKYTIIVTIHGICVKLSSDVDVVWKMNHQEEFFFLRFFGSLV